MKLIFLDIDGVLATPESCMRGIVKVDGAYFNQLQPECVSAINHVTDTTGAIFVISSVWRKQGMAALAKHFKNEFVTGAILGF